MLSLGFLSVFYIFLWLLLSFTAQCAPEMNLTRQTWLMVTSKAILNAAAVKLDLSLEVSSKRVIILTKEIIILLCFMTVLSVGVFSSVASQKKNDSVTSALVVRIKRSSFPVEQ